MTVYVDALKRYEKVKGRARPGPISMAHMTADTLDELHAAAEALGLKRAWYQGPPLTAHAHYDIGRKAWKRAVHGLGAQEVSSRVIAEKARALGRLSALNIPKPKT